MGKHEIKIRKKVLTYSDEQFETLQKVKQLFKNEDGTQLELTPTQCDVFNDIWKRKHPKMHLMAHTRFGKSMTTALAVLLRVSTYPEKWSIIAPSVDKARIIMDYIIQHAFDNEYFKSKLQIGKGESSESLRRKRTKDRINFKHADGTLGEVFILGVNSENKKKAGDAVMGFGAPNVILDEAALVDDEIEGKIFRMLADNVDSYFYLKIGNPFTRGHFLKDTRDPTVVCKNIDSSIGLREGRLSQEYLASAKEKPNYDILFENKFPPADMVDKDGWAPLITEDELEAAFVEDNIPMFGDKRLGVDIAEGGDFNVYVVRSENFAALVRKDQEKNLMTTAGNVRLITSKLEIDYESTYLDAIGVGAGVVDRLKEQRMPVRGVKVSTKPSDSINFYNLKAEAYWRIRDWIKKGGKIKKHPDWYELLDVKYKVVDSSGKMIIMPKDVMRRQGIRSPDTAEALMLTFCFPRSMQKQRAMRRKARKINRKGESGYAMKMC